MDAAPRAVLVDLNVVDRRVFLQVFAIVCKRGEVRSFDVVQRKSERHVTKALVVAVRLAIRRDVHQLRPIPCVGKTGNEPAGQVLPSVQDVAEGYSPGYGPVVKEKYDRRPRRQMTQIRTGRVDGPPGCVA